MDKPRLPETSAPSTLVMRLKQGDRQQSFFFWTTIALSLCIAILSTTGGFIYGDYYGRQHAQFDNPELRNHYAGQCYDFLDNQLKKTIKTSFDKQTKNLDQSKKFQAIQDSLLSIQSEIVSLQGKKPAKEKVTEKNREPRKKLAQSSH